MAPGSGKATIPQAAGRRTVPLPGAAAASAGDLRGLHADFDAESAVVGALIVNPQTIAVVRAILQPEDFYQLPLQRIVAAVYDMADVGLDVTTITLCDELKSRGELEQVGGKTAVHTLADTVHTSTAVRRHAEIVRDCADRRRLVAAGRQIVDSASANGKPIGELVSQAATLLAEVQEQTKAGPADEAHELWMSPRSAVDWAGFAPERPDYVLEPWTAATYLTDIVGREKGGKSTLVASSCRAVAMGEPFLGYEVEQAPVLYLYEGGAQAWRYLMGDAGLLNCRHLHAHLWPMLPPAMRALEWPQMCEWIGELAAKLSVRLVVLDIVPTWARLGADAENDPGVARVIMEALRLMATTYNLAVWTLRHTRKGNDEDHIEASRGTGAWIGSADVSLGYRRPLDAATKREHPTRRLLTSVGRCALPGELAVDYDRERRAFTCAELDVAERRDVRTWLLENLPETVGEAVEGEWSRTKIKTKANELGGYAVNRVMPSLDALVSEGLVRQRRVAAKGGTPANFYTLADPGAELL